MTIFTKIPTTNNFTRRSFVAGTGTALGLLGLSGGPASALSTRQAASLVDDLVEEINTIINSGRSEQQMFGDFEAVFQRYADVPIIARSALGAPARSASTAQLSAFTDVFSGYLSRKYGKRFREFIGGRLEVEGARQVKSFYEVKTTAFLRGEAPFEVVFLVSDRSGRDLFFNMFIEGVNMVATERTEIGALLDRNGGDINRLIKALAKVG